MCCLPRSRHRPRRRFPTSLLQVVSKAMDDRLYDYLIAHTREPPVLAQLRGATAEQFPTGARMQISPEQGAFMRWLVGTLGARQVIEVRPVLGGSWGKACMRWARYEHAAHCNRVCQTAQPSASLSCMLTLLHRWECSLATAA